MKLRIYIAGLFLLFVCRSADAQNTKAAAFKLPAYEKFTLPNGLTIYLMEQHEVPVISFSAVLPAGAIYDDTQSGLASLTADALKLGTKSYSKPQLEKELEFVGASLSTRATKEATNVSSKFAAKDQDKVLAILNEVITKPTFNSDELSKLQQRTLVQLDQARQTPRSVIGSYWDKFIYAGHVYGNPLSGTKASVGKLTQADLKSFHTANYHPNGSAIAVVGDFSSASMKAKLTKLFSSWQKGTSAASAKVSEAVAAPTKSRVLLVNKDDARETTFYIGGIGVSRSNPDYVALQVVNTVFGGRFTSWLNDALRVNSGLTYGASSAFLPQRNSGTFRISTFTKVATTTEAMDMALRVLDSLQKNGINEKSLTSAKNYVKGQFPPQFETSGQLAELLTDMFWYGFDESYINNFEKNVDGLTLAQAKAVISKYYPKNNLQFVVIGKASEIEPKLAKYGIVVKKEIKDDSF
ncbi:MAG: peptidase domain protein [Sphingobacteriaceae bacterium]|jgi:predicted Zn-dependent peptidase|nr:peptidase domain protein [Sphingobacteriaceae bacterium]